MHPRAQPGTLSGVSTPSAPAPAGTVDIEFPLRMRAEDAEGANRGAAETNAAILRLTAAAAPLGPPLPFLVERLLSAAAPFGLEVEIKSEQRVVGTWAVEISQRGIGEDVVSQARADLHVCGSARGDPRAQGAFLVVREWSPGSADNRQVEQLYAAIAVAALERLDSLLGGVPNDTGASRECVLYLVDARTAAGVFRLDRLQFRLLEELEGEHPVVGVDLLVAHGRGTGTRPHGVASTVPTPLAAAPGRAAPVAAAPGLATPSIPVGEVFVPETVAPGNLRWNRRASDRSRALLAAAPAPRSAPPLEREDTG
jgi:hypothetical protein